MNEVPLLRKCTPNSKVKNSVASAARKRRTKLTFQLRCLAYASIFLLFNIQFLISKNLDFDENKPDIEDVFYSHYARNVLSLASTSAIDLEISAADAINHTPKHQILQQPNNQTTTKHENCTQPAISKFPWDGFTRQQRQEGLILIHILISLYSFWLLAVICDDYFLPAIEQICLTLNIQRDVVGATFMAAATSSPELFMNCVGTFVTKGDIGIGTIVGSSVFNILAVPACCGLYVGERLRLDWWPVTRDCLMYCVAVCALIGVLFDGKVMWYEALMLFVAYFLYMTVMYYNDKMACSARKLISKYRRKLHLVRSFREVTEFTPLILGNRKSSYTNSNSQMVDNSNHGNGGGEHTGRVEFLLAPRTFSNLSDLEKAQTDDSASLSTESSYHSDAYSDHADSPWMRSNRCMWQFLLRWPISFVLWLTIPDSRKHPRCKYLTLLLSIAWIGVVSYLVAYAITIIGDTLNIPDSVMGLTILSAGMSIPEAVSSIIVTKQGQGAMGISNAIGSNTFDILLCLSVPWFIKAYFLPNNSAEMWVELNSSGLTYSVVFLLTTVLGLYIAFVVNRFTLSRKIGWACVIMYVVFMIIASLIELNVFFPVNLPICSY